VRVVIAFKSLRRWVQRNPFKAEIVAVEQVPATTRIRINNFNVPAERRQELADMFAYAVQRHSPEVCTSAACEVNDDDVKLFPTENYATVKFHCRTGEIQECLSLCTPA